MPFDFFSRLLDVLVVDEEDLSRFKSKDPELFYIVKIVFDKNSVLVLKISDLYHFYYKNFNLSNAFKYSEMAIILP